MADVEKLLSELRDDRSQDASRVFLEVQSILRVSCPAPASGLHPKKGALLTVDRSITDDLGNTVLIDHTFVHATCDTHSRHSFEFFESLFHKQASHPNLKSVLDKVCSKPVADRQDLKCAKYAPLVQLIDVLRSLGHVHGALPQFLGPSFSSLGEFSGHVFELIEWFIPTVGRKAQLESQFSGITPKTAMREFRTSLKKAFACATAKCTARLITAGCLHAAMHGSLPHPTPTILSVVPATSSTSLTSITHPSTTPSSQDHHVAALALLATVAMDRPHSLLVPPSGRPRRVKGPSRRSGATVR